MHSQVVTQHRLLPMANKEFDIVVFGAASFVGKILCQYLVHEHLEPNLSWAMAGRSESKLRDLKQSLGDAAKLVPIIVVDARAEQALRAMCERTAVIISTVGPYALYGENLVKTCASTGTDYCDLTGEPQWMRKMIDRYQTHAEASGARIVHCCGFDSIPSDLGVKFLQQQALQQFENYCSQVKMRVKVMQGGASGGTIASMLNLYKEMGSDPEVRAQMADIYSLCPPEFRQRVPQQDITVMYDKDFNSWVGPFVMAGINTRVVLRSNALRSQSYAANFSYDEGTLTGTGKKGEQRARRMALGTRMLLRALSIAPVRWLLGRFVVPKPGAGPSPEAQRSGSYDLRFFGRTEAGQELSVKLTGDRDPGYGSTAKMLAQAALSLRRDVDKGRIRGGFWTPATVFDDKLTQRLRNYAGIHLELLEVIHDAAAPPQLLTTAST